MNNILKLPDVSEYYGRYAELYSVLSRDRDFKLQTETMINQSSLNQDSRYLELFSGPAYHAISAQNRFGIESYAIDCSKEMKSEAIKGGLKSENRFRVGLVNNISMEFAEEAPFGLISALRYSIGYITRDELHHMIKQAAKLLENDGMFFIELHKIGSLMNSFQDLEIQERKIVDKNGANITCRWPATAFSIDDDDYSVQMQIDIDIEEPTGLMKKLSFHSKELIYSRGCVDEIAHRANLTPVHDSFTDQSLSNVFPGSVIAIYKKDNTYA